MGIPGFEIFRMRFDEGMTYREINEITGKSMERIRQIINKVFEKIFYEEELRKWKVATRINHLDSDLLKLIYLVGHESKTRICNLINYWGIKKVEDFRLFNLIQPNVKNVGPTMGLKIQIAMLKLGTPYNSDTLEDLEIKLNERQHYGSVSGKKLRFKVLSRDNFTCQYCGQSPRKNQLVSLHVDHIVPAAKGGRFDEDNLTTSCSECNEGKGLCMVMQKK